MLELKDICFSYDREKEILHHVNLRVKEGEIVAILGGSGSGKSTLLNIVCGLESPSSGIVILDGQDITGLPCEKRGIGLVFQDYALFPHLNVEKNVGFALKSYKEPIVGQMLDLVKMSAFKKRYPHELSGGEKQRVAIARSLAAQPKLLLLDEPFSNLDAGLKKSVRQEIKEILLKAKTTAILVTHDVEDAHDLANRIVYLKDGAVEKVVENRKA